MNRKLEKLVTDARDLLSRREVIFQVEAETGYLDADAIHATEDDAVDVCEALVSLYQFERFEKRTTRWVYGFGSTADEALADLRSRGEVVAKQEGWAWDEPLTVSPGMNPYSEVDVFGYVSVGSVTKEES